MTHGGFMPGDRVVADKSLYDNFDEVFVVAELDYNMFSEEVVRVTDVLGGRRDLVFYPQELSHES